MRVLLRRCPHARRIHLVLDNLNIHDTTSLIETFGQQGTTEADYLAP
jgi:hypothetical protein